MHFSPIVSRVLTSNTCFEQKEIVFFSTQISHAFHGFIVTESYEALLSGLKSWHGLAPNYLHCVGSSLAIQNDPLFESIALQNISPVPTASLPSTAHQKPFFEEGFDIFRICEDTTLFCLFFFIFLLFASLLSQSSIGLFLNPRLPLPTTTSPIELLRISTDTICNHGSSPARVRRC